MFRSLCVLLFFCLLILLGDCSEERNYLSAWSQYSLVRPVIYHGRSKRELSSTRQESGSHHDEVLISMDVEGDQYMLELRLNLDLLPEGHSISYQEGGKTILHKPGKEEIDLCQYVGHIRGKPKSWVALSTCRGLRGAIHDGSRIKYIEPAEGNDLQSLHYVYEDNDVERGRCGHDDQVAKLDHLLMKNARNVSLLLRHKRDLSFHLPYKANESSRYVELVLVVDYGLYEDANRDMGTLHYQLQEVTNVMSAIYSPLNIFIALTGVEVWTAGDQIDIDPNIHITLDRFAEYRRQHLFRNKGPHDHAQLLSKQEFLDKNLGLSYVSTMCSYQFSCSVAHLSMPSSDNSISGGTQPTFATPALTKVAHTMAHEMGHSFGMHHDDEIIGCQCHAKSCFMASRYAFTTTWSNCSLKALNDGFSRDLDYCLRNIPERLLVSPSCGNGFVDPGEECDCGPTLEGFATKECHRCCNPETCRFKPRATCATGACCDLQTCQIKSKGALCRAQKESCDLPEYCTGSSEFCPDDVFVMDTTACSNKAYCMQGQCRTHESQCQMLWGNTARNAHPDCYMENTKGTVDSNCGYDMLEDKAKACSREDSQCGRLSCRRNDEMQIGDNQTYTLYSTTIKKEYGVSFECHMARFDFGLGDVDPGFVPDGAACGYHKMCYKQHCLPLNYLRRTIVPPLSSGCLANCSGHGVCNSKGFCHCEKGFEPPLCVAPRARNPDVRNNTLAPPKYPGGRDNRGEQPGPKYPGGRDNRGEQPDPKYPGGRGEQPHPKYPGGRGEQPHPKYPGGRDNRGEQPGPKYPGGRDNRGEQPDPKYPGGRGEQPHPKYPGGRGEQPHPKYPGGRDDRGEQPHPKYPGGRDNKGEQPDPKYPGGRDNSGEKPGPKYPDGRDNRGEQPGPKYPGGRDNRGEQPDPRTTPSPTPTGHEDENGNKPPTSNPDGTNKTTPVTGHSRGANNTEPADKKHADQTFKLVMYIVFLGIFPLIACLLLVCLMKRKSLLCFSKKNEIESKKFLTGATTSVRATIISLFSKKEKYRSPNTNADCDINAGGKSVHEIINTNDAKDVAVPNVTLKNSNVNNLVNVSKNKVLKRLKNISKDDIKLVHDDTNATVTTTNDLSSIDTIPCKRKSDVKMKTDDIIAISEVKTDQLNDAFQKKPTEYYDNAVTDIRTENKNLEGNIDTVIPCDKVKPIPNPKPTTLHLLHTEDLKLESNKVIPVDILKQWPKLKPVKTSVLVNNKTKLKTDDIVKNNLLEGGKDVKTIKKYYEDEGKRNMNFKSEGNKAIHHAILQRPIGNIISAEPNTKSVKSTVKDIKDTIEFETNQNVNKATKPMVYPKPTTLKISSAAIQSANAEDVNNNATIKILPVNKLKPVAYVKPGASNLATDAMKQNAEENNDVGKAKLETLPVKKARPPPNAKPSTLTLSHRNPYRKM